MDSVPIHLSQGTSFMITRPCNYQKLGFLPCHLIILKALSTANSYSLKQRETSYFIQHQSSSNSIRDENTRQVLSETPPSFSMDPLVPLMDAEGKAADLSFEYFVRVNNNKSSNRGQFDSHTANITTIVIHYVQLNIWKQ